MPKPNLPPLPDDTEALRQRCEELELDNAILRETIDILKKDPSVDPQGLSNREKTQVVAALKTSYPLHLLMMRLELSRSSYYFQQRRLSQPDPHAELRATIRTIFEENRCSYGYRRIWMSLSNRGIRV